jgi:hypothetical protein
MVLDLRRAAMARRRHKSEEIVAKLRLVDALTTQVQSVADAVKTRISHCCERRPQRCAQRAGRTAGGAELGRSDFLGLPLGDQPDRRDSVMNA